MAYGTYSQNRNKEGKTTAEVIEALTHDQRLELYEKVVAVELFADTLPNSQRSIKKIRAELANHLVEQFVKDRAKAPKKR